ncbi:MAG: LTA synthase family protein [Oscillospiraceae bacterium]|nr:LTA synthase family protein [Oscillospiraceae bacterium]
MLKTRYFSWRMVRSEWNKTNYLRLLIMVAASVLINLAVEMFSRRSFLAGFSFLAESPSRFFYDTLIILFTLSVTPLFRRRTFYFILISCTWLGLGITNFILLGHRATPLTMPDIMLLSTVRDIIEKYMSYPQIALLILVISVVIGLIIWLWLRMKRHKPPYYFALVHFLLIGAMLVVTSVVFWKMNFVTTRFTNLPEAYDDNGFVYCFSVSALTQGIDEPENYGEEAVSEILAAQEALPQSKEDTPNIIFVQLESFYDLNFMKDLTFAENPLPNFTALKESHSSGLFYVPSIGAGTANTEFEVLSGMNLDHFGVGEYPYKTVIRHDPCDSIAYALQNLGYETHALHNNNATFYSRDRVYANFGFQTFTSLEYMDDIAYNPIDWAKDTVLTAEILDVLSSSDARDFVFAVSVQAHGKYPTEPINGAQTIAVTGIADAERQNAMEYYAQQVKETDQFVGELVAAISDFDEPTVVVFYGDHLPSLNVSQEELSKGTVQTTEYVIWANYAMEKADRDVQAYQLAAVVFDRIGIHEGTLTRYHQLHADVPEEDEVYQSGLETLEYDLIYGDQFARLTDIDTMLMRFGVKPIAITGVIVNGDEETIDIFGTNFTAFSVACVNETPLETIFISPEHLQVSAATLQADDALTVAQVSATDAMVTLSETEVFIYIEED